MQRINNRESKEQRQGNAEDKSTVKDKKTDQDVNTQESDAGERKNLKKKRISNSI
ncbi:hypothetical protein [Flavobacterium sp. CF136]|uniref:hypothetical protein n=1 Tax=Flavobacterium sp. (strain CF136) TaxID=1144313 RepID=UPI0002F5D560|nr:hypothetical protein [Flavobacterium sp. CF136]